MTIETPKGHETVTSASQGNLNTVLGAAGTLLGLMNGGVNVLGMGNTRQATTPCGEYVTRHELDLVQQLQTRDIELAKKDSELAIQKSENYTDKKLVEVTTYVDSKINRLADKVETYHIAQQEVNAQQMAYNAAANASIDVLKSQIAALSGVTKVYIPQSNICDNGCACGCNR